MDNNNWRPAQDGAESAIDTGDWRTQLQNESRQRIVNKITDTLKRHLPFSGQEGLLELKKIAVRFEEKIYTAATSQSDYLRKISLKMLTMESKSQNSMANSLPSNPADAGSLGMQSQIGNQGPLLPVGQPRQQLLAQNIQNNITTTGLQDSCCLTSAMPGGGFLPQTSMPGVVQNINLQNMQSISGVSQNSVANSMGQGVSANMYANTQRQMQGRQQLMGQLGPQGNVPGLQHQPMLGTQSGNSSMQKNQHPVYIMQQSKVSMPQENQQNITPFLPSHGQHSQSAMANQQLMLQIQSQPGQLQQQQNPLHRDMQQRLQQRTLPEAPSTSSDSTAQTENGNSGDWQEEAYQKILTMKEAYMSELQEIYLKIAYKLQQHDNLPQQPKNEQVEKLKIFKTMLERIMTFLQVPKNNILPTFNEKLGGYEKQILNLLNSIRALKPGALMQQSQQLTQPQMHQPQLSQISQAQSHDNPMSSQVQSMNLQGSVNTWQQNNLTSLQHNSLSSLSGVPNASQSLMNPLQSISNLSSSQGNPLHTIPQTAVGSIQQSSSAPQQCNSNMLQHQQLKQEEQQMLQNQMTQTFRHHHMQQQLIHEQQLQQQQQRQILQQKQEQNSQMQANQMTLLHQLNDMDMKMRQQLGVKGGSLLQNQRSMYHHQQLKSGSLQCPISSMESMEWRIHGMESRIPQMEMEIIILKGENSVLQAQITREMKIAKEQKGARVVPVLLFCFVLMVFVMVTKSSGKGKNLLALD